MSNIHETLREYMDDYVAWSDESFANICALWVIHTWAFESARTTPYLYVHSPEKQSGKTRLLEVLESVARNPMRATDVTPSVLFRSIEAMQPTLMLDEVDAVWAGGGKHEAMRGLINGGYKMGGSVYRIVAGEPTRFSTFSPKVLAGIQNGHLPDTIADRCVPIVMRRKPVELTMDAFFIFELEEEIEEILSQIEAWVEEHGEELKSLKLEQQEGLSDRQWEICSPLVAIASLLGIEEQTREDILTAFALDAEAQPPSQDAQLLEDIRNIFDECGRDRVFSGTLVSHLGREAWTMKLISSKLAPYGVQPTTIRIGNSVAKGYYRKDFEQAWATMLPEIEED